MQGEDIKTGYELDVTIGVVPYGRSDLAQWNKASVRRRAQALSRKARSRTFRFGRVHPVELQDCVDRAAERFSPNVELPLDVFWSATRGVYTYYSALNLGSKSSRGYLDFDSSGAIGEGVALYVPEDVVNVPDELGLELMYRPLGDSPDFLMYYANDETRLALVEAKATLDVSVQPSIEEAVITLLEVLRGWGYHRPLDRTDAFAVATSLAREGILSCRVLKLRCEDRDSRP